MRHSSGKLGRCFVWAAGLLLLIILPACRTPDAAGSPIITSPAIAVTAPAATETVATPSPAVSAADPSPSPVVTIAAPASPTRVQTSTPVAESTVFPGTAVPTPTGTPPPTFTPPPPPPLVEGEHLFFQRPVPKAGPAWTDKSYPYGGTRGGALRPHHGVEFNVPAGTPVLAVAAGTVVVAGDDSLIAYGPQTDFYGNLVVVELDVGAEGSPVFVLYGHLSEVSVIVGQTVAVGEVLGLSGATGIADGPHLHLEVRVGSNDYGTTRNPLLWFVPLSGTGVVVGRVVGPGGETLREAPVRLLRVDATAPYAATSSYAAAGPTSDTALGENFALDDVAPGFYQAVVDAGERRYTTELWVYPGRINWVELVVGR